MNSIFKKYQYYILPISLILVLSFSRLIPHPWNFTPILATGIFSGFYFKQIYLSSLIVITSMFIGDLFLGFHSTMLFTYISLIVGVLLGFNIKKFNYSEILFSGLAASISFFIITNFGAWATLAIYEKNLAGLFQSYVLAIPFFHNTLISTLLYLFVIKQIFNIINKTKVIKNSF